MARNSQKQKLFNGRDHSWMQFNRRVLEEAEDPANPLLERVKFLAITGSNLDEYVEIRQAGLMQRIEDGYREQGYDGLRPDESLAALTAEIHTFVKAQYDCWNQRLLPDLRKNGIRLLEWKELDEEARTFAQSYFQREVDPLLTPIAIDPTHPFPRVLNKALCLALLLRRKRKSSGPQVLGVVTVPRALPRFVRLPAADGNTDYILLQDLIAKNLGGMYRGEEAGVLPIDHVLAVGRDHARGGARLREHLQEHVRVEPERGTQSKSLRKARGIDVHDHVDQGLHLSGGARGPDVAEQLPAVA